MCHLPIKLEDIKECGNLIIGIGKITNFINITILTCSHAQTLRNATYHRAYVEHNDLDVDCHVHIQSYLYTGTIG
jgi:hypothetical protein